MRLPSHIQESLLMCTMKVVSVKKGIVEFTTTLNENAIRKKLLAIHEDGIIVQLS